MPQRSKFFNYVPKLLSNKTFDDKHEDHHSKLSPPRKEEDTSGLVGEDNPSRSEESGANNLTKHEIRLLIENLMNSNPGAAIKVRKFEEEGDDDNKKSSSDKLKNVYKILGYRIVCDCLDMPKWRYQHQWQADLNEFLENQKVIFFLQQIFENSLKSGIKKKQTTFLSISVIYWEYYFSK